MTRHTLRDWLDWQETLHPSAIDLGLERVQRVWQAMGAPQPAPLVITVAGTNGKGSSIAMLDAILRRAGYRTGVYTSPHLLHYNERLRIDGVAADDEQFCDAFSRIDVARGDISLTYFEFGTLAALDIMARARPDVALLEVGMGGRLDATNIIDADVALITSIGLDHTQWLGDSLEAIAAEKAGIMRPGRAVVFAAPRMPATIREHARQLGSTLYARGEAFDMVATARHWDWQGADARFTGLPLPALAGAHQLDNAAAVLMVLTCIRDRCPLDEEAVRRGLAEVSLPGRLQYLQRPLPTLLDVAHNPDGVASLGAFLRHRPVTGVTRAVAAFMADKDLVGMIRPLGDLVHKWYLAPLPVPRSAVAGALAQLAAATAIDAGICSSPSTAWRQALADSEEGDRIVVYGSFLTVAAVLSCVSGEAGLE